MFDRLFDFITLVWEWFIPFTIVDCFERGVVLRWGKFHRIAYPGFNWHWCFGVEKITANTVVRQTSYLDVQSLTTQDGKSVSIAGIVIYSILKIEKFLLEIDDGETDLNNIVYGIISDAVEETNWEDIRGQDFNEMIFRRCETEAREHCGVTILDMRWSDKTVARSLRIWND